MAVDDRIPLPDAAELEVVIAVPEGPGPFPVVIAVHEAFGIDESMRAHVDRLARAGYLTVMPNLYTRGGAKKCLMATFRALLSGSGQAFDDLERTRAWVSQRPNVTHSLGVIGFCMGGGFALMLAGRGYDAAAVNYGALPRNLDSVLSGACPIVASYGHEDKTLSGSAAKLTRALTRNQVPHDVVEYPHTGHAFLNPLPAGPAWMRGVLGKVMGVTTNPDAAPDAWNRIEAFFGQHLSDKN
jgi:carboxymethylenebutenolidase